jgi:hypothetical protein
MTIRRLKTYAGAQGYVYQYYFVGKRAGATPAPKKGFSGSAGAAADEYIFDVTSDRQSTYAVSILFPHAVLKAWADVHGRILSDTEQYAAVKMRLFCAFDQESRLTELGRHFSIDLEFLGEALAALRIE